MVRVFARASVCVLFHVCMQWTHMPYETRKTNCKHIKFHLKSVVHHPDIYYNILRKKGEKLQEKQCRFHAQIFPSTIHLSLFLSTLILAIIRTMCISFCYIQHIRICLSIFTILTSVCIMLFFFFYIAPLARRLLAFASICAKIYCNRLKRKFAGKNYINICKCKWHTLRTGRR